jgi:hypothetical protein
MRNEAHYTGSSRHYITFISFTAPSGLLVPSIVRPLVSHVLFLPRLIVPTSSFTGPDPAAQSVNQMKLGSRWNKIQVPTLIASRLESVRLWFETKRSVIQSFLHVTQKTVLQV